MILWRCGNALPFCVPSMSLCLYRNRLALQSRIPSIMEAWFNSSEITASSAPSNTSKIPAFASKQLAYKMESSFPWNFASFSSNSLCKSWNQPVNYIYTCTCICKYLTKASRDIHCSLLLNDLNVFNSGIKMISTAFFCYKYLRYEIS